MNRAQTTDCVSCGRRFAVLNADREHYCPGCQREHLRASWSLLYAARRRLAARRAHARRLGGAA